MTHLEKCQSKSTTVTELDREHDPTLIADKIYEYFTPIAKMLTSKFLRRPPVQPEPVTNRPKFVFKHTDEIQVEIDQSII